MLNKGVNEEYVYDLLSSQDWKDYLREVKTKRITKTTHEGGIFKYCLNGMRHNSIQAKKNGHCQYCYFQYMNEVPESKREHYPELRWNQSGVQQCLQCNVSLCPQCDRIFHGADLSAHSSLSMEESLLLSTSTKRWHWTTPRCKPIVCPERVWGHGNSSRICWYNSTYLCM